MRKNLFTTVTLLMMSLALIATLGIGNVSAAYPVPEIVVYPQFQSGATGSYIKYAFNIKNAPHTDAEVTIPSEDRTWSWQVKLTWDPTVLTCPSSAWVMEKSYTTTRKGFLGYFHYYASIPFPPFYEEKPYPRSGLTVSLGTGSAVIFDGMKSDPDVTTVPKHASDPDYSLHLGSNYDLPYSAGLSGHGDNPDELCLFEIWFEVLKDGPPYSTPITVELGVDTFFMSHDSKTEYHVSLPQAWFGEIGPHLHHVGSPIPDPSDPVGTQWHELYPAYCNYYDLTGWQDNGDTVLSACDNITLKPTDPAGDPRAYHVEGVTTTITVSLKPELVDTMYIDYELPADILPGEVYDPITEPVGTQWHELYPDYCTRYQLAEWEDTGADGELNPSDQIYLVDKETGAGAWYHVDDVSTDIIVKPEPGLPVPEFPLGIGLLMTIALVIPIVYLWRSRKKVVR